MREARPVVGFRLALLAVALLVAPAPAPAHEIPADVTVQAFVEPAGRSLTVLLRVPLEAMRDVEWPLLGPGYLDIGAADPALREAASLWLVDELAVFENGRRLENPRLIAVRASRPADRSFATYASALAHMRAARLPQTIALPWQQAALDVLYELPIASETAAFSLDTAAFARLGQRVTTVLRFLPADGTERLYELSGGATRLALDPRWYQAASRFVRQGFAHILGGTDHLLFLLCLMLPLRRDFKALLWVVTAFTVAHSATLAMAACGLIPGTLWFAPLIELLIAVSVFYTALENVIGGNLRHRWVIALTFGLIHGFGFAFALRQTLQLAGRHFAMALVAFNVGVELGQIVVLLAALPLLTLLLRYVVEERLGTIIISVLVGHTAWHWAAERLALLRQYQLGWQDLAPVLAALLGLIGVALSLAAIGRSALRWSAARAVLGPADPCVHGGPEAR
jgi:HupE / UreJ protein